VNVAKQNAWKARKFLEYAYEKFVCFRDQGSVAEPWLPLARNETDKLWFPCSMDIKSNKDQTTMNASTMRKTKSYNSIEIVNNEASVPLVEEDKTVYVRWATPSDVRRMQLIDGEMRRLHVWRVHRNDGCNPFANILAMMSNGPNLFKDGMWMDATFVTPYVRRSAFLTEYGTVISQVSKGKSGDIHEVIPTSSTTLQGFGSSPPKKESTLKKEDESHKKVE
jgi:hypothetical protein